MQIACMEPTNSLANSSAHEGSARFGSLFLQRVCHSAATVHDKLGFSCHQPTVVGVYMFQSVSLVSHFVSCF